MSKLKLSVKQIRDLQKKHEITNLLNPSPEDTAKVVNIDFLTDFYFEGSRKWEQPPEREAIEDLDLRDLLSAWQAYMKADGEGNG